LHAEKRMIERGISEEQIKQILEGPDFVKSEGSKRRAEKAIDERKIRIVYIEEENYIKIVTVF